MAANRDQILAALGRFAVQTVEVAGIALKVRPVSIAGMSRIHAAEVAGDRAAMVVAMLTEAVVDDDGKRMFTEADAIALMDMPGDVATAIVDAITKASGLGETPADIAGN
jgi:hypothetical protein